MKLIEDVPKWVGIIYLIVYKLDLWIWNRGLDLQIFTSKLSAWRERFRSRHCNCEQCIERKGKV